MAAQFPAMDCPSTTAPRHVALSSPDLGSGVARDSRDANDPASLSPDDPACALEAGVDSSMNVAHDATSREKTAREAAIPSAPRPLVSLVSRHFDQTLAVPSGADPAALLASRDEPSSLAGFDPVGLRDGQTVLLGRYEVLGEIARGGMGVVYRARQIGLNRVVALKMVLAGRFADAADVHRLHVEAAVTAKLRHPNIVRIYEFTEFEGRHFIAMDFVPGRSLAQEARQFPMSPTRSAELLLQLADAVHYAHGQGVLHRDLKPSNILLDGAGRPQITDFGVAKELFGEPRGTTIGRVVGTPAYMPPEQAGGQKHLMGPASDVYSLGAMLYELLAGRPPFQAANALDVFTQIKSADPLPPTLFNPKTPPDLQTICLKCLAKEPRRRYATAKDLADDLRRFLAGEPILARPMRVWERAIQWAQRRPAAAACVGMAVSALICVNLSFVWYHTQLNESHERLAGALELAQRQTSLAEAERKKAENQRRIASEQHRVAEQQRELSARRHLYAVNLALVQDAWRQAHVGRVLELLEGLRPQPGQADVRGFEWHYFWRQVHTNLATLTGHAKAVTSVVATPDGKHIV
ncbi:MAG TPA: protein kinase, partial [Pirellulales bacterium]